MIFSIFSYLFNFSIVFIEFSRFYKDFLFFNFKEFLKLKNQFYLHQLT